MCVKYRLNELKHNCKDADKSLSKLVYLKESYYNRGVEEKLVRQRRPT